MTRIVVVAVPWMPKRARNAMRWREEFGAEIVWDEKQDPMDTFRRALERAGSEPVILVEDDALPVEGWREKTGRCIAEKTDEVIQFYTSGIVLGARRTSGWEEASTMISAVCFYLPRGAAESLRDYASGWEEREPQYARNQDVTVARWLQEEGSGRYWLQAPSLVQHAASVSSINPRLPKKRISYRIDGELAWESL